MSRYHVSFSRSLALGLALASLVGCGSDPAPATDAGTTTDTGTTIDTGTTTDTGAVPDNGPPSGLTGEMLAAMRGCNNCHQSTNAADGVLSGQTTARPMTTSYGSNLTPDPTTGMGVRTEDEIVRALREGVRFDGRTLCRTMPRYATLPDGDLRVLARYLMGLTPVNRAIPASVCAM